MKLLKQKDVLEKTTMSKSTMYSRITQGDFPPPIKLGGEGTKARSARWVESEVDEWIMKQIEKSRNG